MSRVMGLHEEIRAIRYRALADLNSAHDYFADTQIAWQIVEEVIAESYHRETWELTRKIVAEVSDLAIAKVA